MKDQISHKVVFGYDLGMRIGIVGWGVETKSAYNFFGDEHDYLIVNEEPRDDFPAVSDKIRLQFLPTDRPVGMVSMVEDLSYLEGIDKCDKIIYQPTAYHNLKKTFGNDSAFWSKATTVLHIFFETVKTKNIIGVTGSKGKGTTSTLIAKMLEAAGKKVHLGGNIGLSVLDFVKDVGPDDWVVLEIANFQLHEFPYSPHIALCLMITREHMDWHPDLDEYVAAKANIFKHQKPDDIAIYYDKNKYSKEVAAYSPGKKVPYYAQPGAYVRDDGMIVAGESEVEIMPKTGVKLLGEHNLQNICAAITAVWEISQSLDPIKEVLSSFSGLEHRLEFVRSLDGVKYYDDSFATTPESTIVALRAFKEPKIVILGGHDKGLPFEALAAEVAANNVRRVIAIGQTAGKITELLKARGFTDIVTGVDKMPDIVAAARKTAQPGDVVLLSTACASFGLFKDYKERGEQFKQAVMALK